MKTMLSTATSLLLFVIMISPLYAEEETQAPDVGSNYDATNACTVGYTGWLRPIEQIHQSGSTTYAWLPTKGHWVYSTNDVTEVALINCVASAHFCQFNITSCGTYAAINVVKMFRY